MGRLNAAVMRYLEKEHFRVLVSVEMGMKNHEMVPLELIASIATIHRGAVARILHDLLKHSLVAHERGKRYDGYRLTNSGYDILALKALCSRSAVGAVGNQIGVGKESDVFIGGDQDFNDLVLKFHRLGRTSFRKLKEKRDYHNKRKSCSWLYLSRLAAAKEFAFLKALHQNGFHVPKPIDVSRHLVVMEFIDGYTLCDVQKVEDAGALYDELMSVVVKLAKYGLIHGDFNEFNLMLTKDDNLILIDMPQMVSVNHPNAKYYFERDVECVRKFFRKRFSYETESYPKFEDIKKKYDLDVEVSASGFTARMAKDLNQVYDTLGEKGDYTIHAENGEKVKNEDVDDDSDETDDESSSTNGDADDVDNEDESQKQENSQNKISNRRLDEWIKSARNELEKLNFESSEDCTQVVDLLEDNSICEKQEHVLSSADRHQIDDIPKSSIDCSVNEKIVKEAVSKTKSVLSTGSTIAPQEIRKRLNNEYRTRNKIHLRVKGKANALNRQRKANSNIIKEYAGWDL